MVMAELVYRPGKEGPLERTIQEGRLVRVMLSRGQEGEEMKISLLPRKGEQRKGTVPIGGPFLPKRWKHVARL